MAKVSLVLVVFLDSAMNCTLSGFEVHKGGRVCGFFAFKVVIPMRVALVPLFVFCDGVKVLGADFSLVLPRIKFTLPLTIVVFMDFCSFIPSRLIRTTVMSKYGPNIAFVGVIFPLTQGAVVAVTSVCDVLV